MFNSAGTLKASATSIKLTGVIPETLNAASIVHDSTKSRVGDSNTTITLNVTPKATLSTGYFVSVYFP